MRTSFRSFALRCQRVIRRSLRKLAKHFRSAIGDRGQTGTVHFGDCRETDATRY